MAFVKSGIEGVEAPEFRQLLAGIFVGQWRGQRIGARQFDGLGQAAGRRRRTQGGRWSRNGGQTGEGAGCSLSQGSEGAAIAAGDGTDD